MLGLLYNPRQCSRGVVDKPGPMDKAQFAYTACSKLVVMFEGSPGTLFPWVRLGKSMAGLYRGVKL